MNIIQRALFAYLLNTHLFDLKQALSITPLRGIIVSGLRDERLRRAQTPGAAGKGLPGAIFKCYPLPPSACSPADFQRSLPNQR